VTAEPLPVIPAAAVPGDALAVAERAHHAAALKPGAEAVAGLADDRTCCAVLAGPGRSAELLTLRGAGRSTIVPILLGALHRRAILLRALNRADRSAILLRSLDHRSPILLAAGGADRGAILLHALNRAAARLGCGRRGVIWRGPVVRAIAGLLRHRGQRHRCDDGRQRHGQRSEEHTSELQSLTNLVCRLLLEKKKKKNTLERITSASA